jgi:uncharacterized membrane protein
MTKKQRIELILLTIFLLSGICTFFKVPYSAWVLVVSAFFIGSLYFYLAFWLFADYNISLTNRRVAGLVFSANIIACMFCLLNWPGWYWDGIFCYAGLAAIAIIVLFNYKRPDYKQLLYRGIFFIAMLSLIFGYRSFLA